MTRILVTGGTGVLGRQLVTKLDQAGYTVRVMSRRSQPATRRPGVEWAQADLATGQGLVEAVSGVSVILHAATSPSERTRQIDVDGTRRLLEQARSAGASHFIYVSIVGIERIPHPYYQHKAAVEALVEGAGLPWSILRATQFHDLIDGFLQPVMRFPLMFGPTDFQFQPVDAGEVAEAVCRCAAAGPSGRLTDMGGPEVLRGGEMARAWLKARGMRRPIIHLPLPGKIAHGFRNGYNTCPQHRQGRVTWEEWLQKKYGVGG
ncbi:MAG: SDR family oxidoreductase [Anaerolineae bacterium]